MSKINDESTTGTSLADDGTDSVTVTTSGGDQVYVFIDDDADPPGDHAGYELTVEVEGLVGGTRRFQEWTTVGGDGSNAETARSWTFRSVDDNMKFTLTNRSGGTADYALRAVSIAYNG